MKYLYTVVIVGSVISAVGFSIYEEQRFNEKCEEAGTVAVRPWRDDPYCAKGFR